MAGVVMVHGIWNRQRGMEPGEAAVALAKRHRSRLEQGLAASGLTHVPVPDVAMAYYAHVLSDGWQDQAAGQAETRLEDLSPAQQEDAREWLELAGVPVPQEMQAGVLAPLRQMVGWLVRRRTGDGVAATVHKDISERLSRLIIAFLQDTDAYTSRPRRRQQAREVVAQTIREHRPTVVVAHSLGSVVAYEALHEFSDLQAELLVTLGSPLGLPAMMRKLDPEPISGYGQRPPGVGRWVNVADVGDLVALPPKLGGCFPVDAHETTDIGLLAFHSLERYLADGMTGAVIAPHLAH
ncbi:hypothetical protein ABZY05_47705 [Streptomyces canus]|uniref:hypothetical protein n=1 Tax=Streptomyces canus TaxID=58343 RepID=UPI0033B1A867